MSKRFSKNKIGRPFNGGKRISISLSLDAYKILNKIKPGKRSSYISDLIEQVSKLNS